jgi:hypothetical protein
MRMIAANPALVAYTDLSLHLLICGHTLSSFLSSEDSPFHHPTLVPTSARQGMRQ